MKIKFGIIVFSIFLMACGSSEQKTDAAAGSETAANEKFIIKASNMQYLALGPNNVLIANQADPTKAEVFEKIDIGGGKYNLRASNGKFMCDDRAKSDSVFADKEKASDWEQFEIVALEGAKVNLKSSTGKYVTADLGLGGVIVSVHDQASDWELFELEKK